MTDRDRATTSKTTTTRTATSRRKGTAPNKPEAPPKDGGVHRANGSAVAGVARTAKIVVRSSQIHGRGVYAARKLKQGERIIEYKGERISWKQADRLPPSDPDDPHHTFLFSLDDGKHVIDASRGGNAARWINHSCEPNCETEETDDGRVFIDTLRDVRSGEELYYDYSLIIDERMTPTLKAQYACRCGTKTCRGTMLALKKKKRKR